MIIDRNEDAEYKHEYDVRVRRLTDFLTENTSPQKYKLGGSLVEFAPGETVREHVNRDRVEEIFVLLDGKAEFFLDGKTEVLRSGDLTKAPVGMAHSFTNVSDAPSRLLCLWWETSEAAG